jgi:hypothetical protein
MRPCVEFPFMVRGLEYGGAKPLFCVPLVSHDSKSLRAQAEVAHGVNADLIEWRADSFRDYYNGYRTHNSLRGRTPDQDMRASRPVADFHAYQWQPHCRGLYQTPVAA